MERRYISPEMDIIEFDTNDLITTSGELGGEAGSKVIDVNGITDWSDFIEEKINNLIIKQAVL